MSVLDTFPMVQGTGTGTGHHLQYQLQVAHNGLQEILSIPYYSYPFGHSDEP